MDMTEYEKMQATIKLLSKLSEVQSAVEAEDTWLPPEDVRNQLEL